jgi:CheY-like chemotaxis protein
MDLSKPVPYRVLLIEDAEPDALLVSEALERGGLNFDLEVLDDGEKAVEFVERVESDDSAACPDLIILDLNLPKMGGCQVLERVRKKSRFQNVPVVILTSSDSPRDRVRTASLGATGYFQKSSRLDDFMKLGPMIRGLLEH